MAVTEEDLRGYDDSELEDLRLLVMDEQERRRILVDAPAEAEEIARRYLEAAGRTPGDPWVQPVGAHDAYPLGWVVGFGGKFYRSLIPANVWSPSVYPAGWEETDDPGGPIDPPPTYPAWAPGLSVKVGEVYTYGGRRYSVIQAHSTITGWEPPGVPALWLDLGPVATP